MVSLACVVDGKLEERGYFSQKKNVFCVFLSFKKGDGFVSFKDSKKRNMFKKEPKTSWCEPPPTNSSFARDLVGKMANLAHLSSSRYAPASKTVCFNFFLFLEKVIILNFQRF